MSGQQHYVMAEQYLTEAAAERARGSTTAVAVLASLALAHATLANAAAVALDDSRLETETWREVAGTRLGGDGPQPAARH